MPDPAHRLAQIDDQLSGLHQRIEAARRTDRGVEVIVLTEAFDRLLDLRFKLKNGYVLGEHVTEDEPCGS